MPRKRSMSHSASISPPRGARAARGSPPPRSPSPPRCEYPQQQEEAQPPKLFIASLDTEVTEDDLRTLFQPFGEIVDFFMKSNDRGPFAFITFNSLEEAEKAKEETNGTELHGKNIRVNYAKPRAANTGGSRACFKCQQEGHMARDCPNAEGNNGRDRRPRNFGNNQQSSDQEPKLFITALDNQVTQDDLRTLFQVHGEIVDINMRSNDRGPFAFVTFSSLEEAEKGKECNGADLHGKSIRVNFAKPRANAGGNQGGSRACFKCQKEGHMARDCPGVQENGMEVEKPVYQQKDQPRGRRRSVSRSGSGSPPRGMNARRSSPLRASSPPRYEQSHQQSDQEPKLFITALAPEVTEDDLRDLFQTHGEIVDIYMKSNDKGTFAFVTYSSLEEAEKGKDCNGAELHGKNIRVNFAKPKGNAGGNRGPRVCFKCQKEGHMARDCPGVDDVMVEEKPAYQPNQPPRGRKRSVSGSGSPQRGLGVRRSSPPRNTSPPRYEQPQQSDQEPKLFITALDSQVTDDDLRTLFQPFGEIVDLYMKSNDRGPFAFVTFSSLEEAEKGKECNGVDLHGKSIRVNFAKPRANAGGNQGGSRACFKCQKEGHMARDCPGVQENGMEVEKNKWQKERIKTCFKCHQEGHMARECPEANNTDQRRRPSNQNQRNQRGEKVFVRNNYLYNPFTGGEFTFPSGREDFVNNCDTMDIEVENQRLNRSNFGNGSTNGFSQRNNRHMNPLESENKNDKTNLGRVQRKRSVSGSQSPPRGNNAAQTTTTDPQMVKEGFQASKPRQRSRSRSRSNPKPVRKPSLSECPY